MSGQPARRRLTTRPNDIDHHQASGDQPSQVRREDGVARPDQNLAESVVQDLLAQRIDERQVRAVRT